jgi:type IV pilus assembly protein PilB
LANEQNCQVEYYVVSQGSLQAVLAQYKKIEEEISTALEIKAKEEALTDGEEELVQINSEEKEGMISTAEDANSAPVARIVSAIIRRAVEKKASDIHIEPLEKESRIRYRIDGILRTFLTLPKSVHGAVVARIKVLSKLKLDETRIPQDGRIRLLVNNKEIDFRVSTFPLLSNLEKIVLRVLDSSRGIPTLPDLGFSNHVLKVVERNIRKTTGVVLVTGPTGSGKSTTLYAVLSLLNKEGINISTLEDPIEYEIKGINQSQVRPKIGYTFASGLRSILRQDPNIIMVGEIRDEESAELCIHASLTGHLVLSTLHTNDALGSIFRLLDMKIEGFLLASSLKLSIAQRLVRLLCPHCKKEEALTPEEIKMVIKELTGVPEATLKDELPQLDIKNLELSLRQLKIFKEVGCQRCDNNGFSGRSAIGEVVEVDEELREIIINREMKNLNINTVKKNQEFISLKQDGIIKVLKGLTTMEEALRVMES